MKQEIQVPRPFLSGSCQTCILPVQVSQLQLCGKCLEYVDQDYRSQRDYLMAPHDFELLSDSETSPCGKTISFSVSENIRKKLRLTLRRAKLTLRQKQIVQLILLQGRTFFDAAKYLGISKTCLQNHMERVRKKLQIRGTRALLSKGDEFSSVPRTVNDIACDSDQAESPEQLIEAPKDTETEVTVAAKGASLRHICPRCRDRVFQVSGDYQYCMHCLWNSDEG